MATAAKRCDRAARATTRDAVEALDRADPSSPPPRALRDQLANTADVSTLTQWLDRNAAIDAALRRLYTVLAGTGGTVTEEARRALDDVKAAQAQLPPDTRALVVIMADIARAGLNRPVIRIEESRGKLADAIARVASHRRHRRGHSTGPTSTDPSGRCRRCHSEPHPAGRLTGRYTPPESRASTAALPVPARPDAPPHRRIDEDPSSSPTSRGR